HELVHFACGRPALDAWLRTHALASHRYGHARTQVVADTDAGVRRVVAFYALAPASVVHARLSAKLRQNAPDPVPMILLARLAVDAAYAGRGIGRHLLLDAFKRAELAAREIGGRGIIANAKDEPAAAFYLRWKFRRMPSDPLLLVIPMELVRASLTAAAQEAA
ncbi:MAG: GNAT family N-acetyltransferase, partial [Acetobacteraceae bacterium]